MTIPFLLMSLIMGWVGVVSLVFGWNHLDENGVFMPLGVGLFLTVLAVLLLVRTVKRGLRRRRGDQNLPL